MFINYIKNFYAKKTLKKNLQNVKSEEVSNAVKTVGLLIDASFFSQKEALIADLISNGFSKENIKVIVYTDKSKSNGSNLQLVFGAKHLNWKGEITEPKANDFLNEEFDLLISYYDVEKTILMLFTLKSKAKFKVGFASIDKRLNHLIINTEAENYKVFTDELFRYLKLLNKI
jgi:hypothetical protein